MLARILVLLALAVPLASSRLMAQTPGGDALAEVRRQAFIQSLSESFDSARGLRDAGRVDEALGVLRPALRAAESPDTVQDEDLKRWREALRREIRSLEDRNYPSKAAKPTPYVYGKILKFSKKKDALEFGLSARDGVRSGAALPVRRPIEGGRIVGEIKVSLVDNKQAVGLVTRGMVIEGDEIVLQRVMTDLPPDLHDLDLAIAEMTFDQPGAGGTQRTFHARILKSVWKGPLDLSFADVELFLNDRSQAFRYPGSSISQVRVRGVLLVADKVKGTLVPAEILPIREKLRSDEKRLQELRLAEIQANERVKVAEIQADERVRVASIEASERVKLAESYAIAQAQRAVDSAHSARERAEQEAAEWRRNAEEAMAASRSGGSDPVGQTLGKVAGFLSLTKGLVAARDEGGLTLDSANDLAAGAKELWEAFK